MLQTARYLLIICSVLLSICSYAQDPYHIVINKSNGLPSNSIYDLFQDSKGFIWIANNEGLTRYDGFEYKTYINDRQTSRAGNEIEEDKYGRIWYQNFDGYLYYVEHDTLKPLKQTAAIVNSGYAIINDRIILLQNGNVNIINLETQKTIKTIPIDLTKFISNLHLGNYFYVLNDSTLYKISPEGTIEQTSVPTTGRLTASKNGILIVNREGKNCFEIDGQKAVKKIAIPEISYMHGTEYCAEIHWIFTPNGVWAYDQQGLNINKGAPFFADKSISSILKDREGNYWMGTLDNGILFIPDIQTKLITAVNLTPNVLKTSNNCVYIGTKENTIYAYNADNNELVQKYTGKVRHEILNISTNPLLDHFYIAAEQFITTDKNLKPLIYNHHSIKDIAFVDGKYIAITGTGITGLLKIKDGGASPWDSIFNSSPTTVKNVSTLTETGRGRSIAYNPLNKNIYSGSNKGLYCISYNRINEITDAGTSIFTRKLVNYGSKVYVLTPQYGLYVIDKENNIVKINLPDDKALNIKHAGDKLYVLTNTGIRTFDSLTGAFTSIHLHPGIRSEEINDLEMIGNKLIIASDKGILVVDPMAPAHDTIAPGFVLNRLLVNGNIATDEKLSNLSYTENDIDINYSILTFNTDRHYKLMYKINTGKWQEASAATRNLKLASLSPGQYDISFQITADDGKVYNKDTVHFTINKPFWSEWWFWASCLIIISASGLTYYKWQTTLLKKQSALMLQKVELEKNLRNSMLTSIRAQMNPHFFYNALNSIQSFIFSDDKRNASTYLVKLSKLTRMILEMSEQESITLDVETDALKLYLELEKMRFTNDFNYELQTDNNVDSELVKIPPMIVQPYVENAIKHGLLHKKGHKYLAIQFTRQGEDLRITIDDNGIGREKASEIKQLKKEKHHPFSTNANSRRIELLNKERSKNIGIVYVDKKDDNGNPTGTTVIISIPLI